MLQNPSCFEYRFLLMVVKVVFFVEYKAVTKVEGFFFGEVWAKVREEEKLRLFRS